MINWKNIKNERPASQQEVAFVMKSAGVILTGTFTAAEKNRNTCTCCGGDSFFKFYNETGYLCSIIHCYEVTHWCRLEDLTKSLPERIFDENN